ncbi:MAG: SPOR domain-containing protein [Rhodocyclaceae bacterium]|nr:SPOR domain-containing protein [Rhodocyclaceae bacterium]MCC6879379.1 SPOR domain-containing protein [Rhodocyclaceae bacterium]
MIRPPKALSPSPSPASGRGERREPLRGYGKSGGGTLLGIFIGLVVGVVIAAGVVWYLNQAPLPFQAKGQKPPVEKNGEAKPAVPVVPEPLPGKPGDKVPEKPRFEFYKILPGGEAAAPQPAEQKPAGAAPKPSAETLFLQAGSFQNPADADNLKARLALMGVEAGVQQVTLAEKGVMHRVRIGPFASVEAMAPTRSLLAQNGIQAGVVRVKDGKDTKDAAN